MTTTTNTPGKLSTTQRIAVWNTRATPNDGTMLCCSCLRVEINWQTYECGHIQSKYSGGDNSISNLMPICRVCNRGASEKCMIDFIRDAGFWFKVVNPYARHYSESEYLEHINPAQLPEQLAWMKKVCMNFKPEPTPVNSPPVPTSDPFAELDLVVDKAKQYASIADSFERSFDPVAQPIEDPTSESILALEKTMKDKKTTLRKELMKMCAICSNNKIALDTLMSVRQGAPAPITKEINILTKLKFLHKLSDQTYLIHPVVKKLAT